MSIFTTIVTSGGSLFLKEPVFKQESSVFKVDSVTLPLMNVTYILLHEQ